MKEISLVEWEDILANINDLSAEIIIDTAKKNTHSRRYESELEHDEMDEI